MKWSMWIISNKTFSDAFCGQTIDINIPCAGPPGNAERVVESLSVERVDELRQGAGGPHDAEHGQEHGPGRQRPAQVEWCPAVLQDRNCLTGLTGDCVYVGDDTQDYTAMMSSGPSV